MISVYVAVDPNLGRVEFSSLPQQTLMEMLVDGFVNKTDLMDYDECYLDIQEWPQLYFNEANDLEIVEWRDLNARYFPDGGVVQINWIPSTVTRFALTGSKMQGTIEIAQLPAGLESLFLQRNALTGTLDLFHLSPSMRRLVLHTNQFNGNLDFSRLPEGLISLLLQKNSFGGDVTVGKFPESVQIIRLGGNSIKNFIDGSGEKVQIPVQVSMGAY